MTRYLQIQNGHTENINNNKNTLYSFALCFLVF